MRSRYQLYSHNGHFYKMKRRSCRRRNLVELAEVGRRYRSIIREKHRVTPTARQLPHIRIHLALLLFEVDGASAATSRSASERDHCASSRQRMMAHLTIRPSHVRPRPQPMRRSRLHTHRPHSVKRTNDRTFSTA